ncbi:MAG: glycosyl hydrolase family 25 [Prevotella sp.]|nr:glycosyl hydrolase family 25 [Prevotella sp.]
MKNRLHLIYISVLLTVCTALLNGCGQQLQQNHGESNGETYIQQGDTVYRGGMQRGKPHGFGILTVGDSLIYAGEWQHGKREGKGFSRDSMGRKVVGKWNADTLVSGRRDDGVKVYQGGFNKKMEATGHGIEENAEGDYYEGHWTHDQRDGQGFALEGRRHIEVGEWRANRHLGQRVKYSSERIYGIDISKYQHVIGKRTYPIDWKKLRIIHLGDASKKTINGKVDYPISFIYIKSTEGSTLLNPFYHADYRAARAHGYHVGTYHFFSIHSSAEQQARHFLKHSKIVKGDFPPVLDVEPSHEQIKKMGGAEVMFARIRTWLKIVEQQTGIRPVLYISQIFVNKYLPLAPDIKQNYDIWIARYGEYKPDVRLLYWQLGQDGRVSGIRGYVDINVFNGYRDAYDEFLENYEIKK